MDGGVLSALPGKRVTRHVEEPRPEDDHFHSS